MMSWGGPPYGRATLPAAMTTIVMSGQGILLEPLCTGDAKRAALRGAFDRRVLARAKRLGGRK